MTIYLFGLIKQRAILHRTYDYIIEHWDGCFSKLPSYQTISYWISQISGHFEPLIDCLSQQLHARPRPARRRPVGQLATDYSLTPTGHG